MSEILESTMKLKPCPFCGNKKQFMGEERPNNIEYLMDDGTRMPAIHVTITCHGCGATVTGRSYSEEIAIEKAKMRWEKRA